ncbi:MmgE/PrpD family protein [Chroococcidiopsis sp. FACHB-1243]|uniref:MmgE/PrpD family protein n=1 Tax=Chroococcidiopsis sp. [FACHB-1243] TaxID=2692781 RepID=UPI00177A9A9E|nr:MmgE/PrpD family protein [Chroococcidiopsis sp. [FACHB-1243]]MBD2309961.1 MmgE/PrpD family protein [Chroococcidiopsis sp. [FACHB-1243]]
MNNSEFSEWGKKLERLAQAGVQKEIAEHKASGRSIFYERNGMTIMELADGRCFEYRLQDGKVQIVSEVEKTNSPMKKMLYQC